jgi:hypothetical protein
MSGQAAPEDAGRPVVRPTNASVDDTSLTTTAGAGHGNQTPTNEATHRQTDAHDAIDDRQRTSADRRADAERTNTSDRTGNSPAARAGSGDSGIVDAGEGVATTAGQAGAATSGSGREQADDENDGDRAGLDTRRRGWFWHWNNVVTQYAPLIGLKGVGLLNSYTVWTDRRDESPHRGYAFPSQQSEADFYGEDRAELITINKILVALDLIEIRKEMLTRVDERGRRWRVPHNLYRVKDRPDGVDLRARDAINVATLAASDDAVFRYVRRVFSERFKPIDGDNVWQRILDELRTDPIWRELQERTRLIEERASARSRAGHKRRNGSTATKPDTTADETTATAANGLENVSTTPTTIDTRLLPVTQQGEPASPSDRTSVGDSNRGFDSDVGAVVDRINRGSVVDVDRSNSASASKGPTTVGDSSNGRQPVVGPSNTTYDQDRFTTTTTTTSVQDDGTTEAEPEASLSTSRPVTVAGSWSDDTSGAASVIDAEVKGNGRDRGLASSRLAAGQRLATMEGNDDERPPAGARTGSNPRERRLADPSAGGPVVDPGPLVVSTFEAANDRRATPLERHLLAELEYDADPAARAAGSTGSDWVIAAMREAVASGSSFVAPKRIREIIARWSANPRNAPASTTPLADDSSSPVSPSDTLDDVRLPGGASGNATWTATLSDLARALDQSAYDRLLADSRITRYWRGTVEITVTGTGAAGKLSNEYRGLVERQLNSRLRRPVAVRFVANEVLAEMPEEGDHSAPAIPDDPQQPLTIDEEQVEIGRQVWQSLLADLGRVVAPSDLERLAGVVVLGQDVAGDILLGTPSPLARRLVDRRYRSEIERSLTALFGQPLPFRTLDASDWMMVSGG